MQNRSRPFSGGCLKYFAACLLAVTLSGVPVDGTVVSRPALAQGGHGLRGDRAGGAIPGAVEEFVLPDGVSAPFSIAVDAAGRVWFAEKVGKALTVFDPGEKRFAIHPLPPDWGNVGPSRIALGPRGGIWFTVRRWAEAVADTNVIGSFDPVAGSFKRHVLVARSPSHAPRPDQPKIAPGDLSVDQQGVVWFLAPDENKVYRFDPASADLEGYRIPTPNSYPRGLSINRKGVLWFVEANVNKIAKFVPGNATFREYAIPTPFSAPATTAVDAQGRVWFVEMAANRIGVLYPDMERLDEALIPTPRSLPNAIAIDGGGKVWFLEYRGNKVGVFDPVEAVFREYSIPTFGSEPGDLAIDHRRGRLWFSESNTEVRKLGMLAFTRARAAAQGGASQAKASEDDGAAGLTGVIVVAGSAILLLAALTGVFLLILKKSWRR